MVNSLRYTIFFGSLMGCCLNLPFLGISPALAQKAAPPAQKPAPSKPKPSQAPAQAKPANNTADPNELRPLAQGESIFSIQGGERLMAEAEAAINNGNYDLAVDKLQQARKVFNQLSNFHLQLANSFSGIDTVTFESQRASALTTGQRRDDATYQLALVHRAQNKPELSVPLLIQIIRSQNPTTPLGRKSYQQLYELGFVDTPFTTPNPSGATPIPSAAPAVPSAPVAPPVAPAPQPSSP